MSWFGSQSTSKIDTGGAEGYIISTKFTLSENGTATSISSYTYTGHSGYEKFAIYADSAGVPGTLKAANNNSNAVSAGWNTFDIGPVELTAGDYWLTTKESTASLRIYVTGATAQTAYKSSTWATDMPSSWTKDGSQNVIYPIYVTYTTGGGTIVKDIICSNGIIVFPR